MVKFSFVNIFIILLIVFLISSCEQQSQAKSSASGYTALSGMQTAPQCVIDISKDFKKKNFPIAATNYIAGTITKFDLPGKPGCIGNVLASFRSGPEFTEFAASIPADSASCRDYDSIILTLKTEGVLIPKILAIADGQTNRCRDDGISPAVTGSFCCGYYTNGHLTRAEYMEIRGGYGRCRKQGGTDLGDTCPVIQPAPPPPAAQVKAVAVLPPIVQEPAPGPSTEPAPEPQPEPTLEPSAEPAPEPQPEPQIKGIVYIVKSTDGPNAIVNTEDGRISWTTPEGKVLEGSFEDYTVRDVCVGRDLDKNAVDQKIGVVAPADMEVLYDPGTTALGVQVSPYATSSYAEFMRNAIKQELQKRGFCGEEQKPPTPDVELLIDEKQVIIQGSNYVYLDKVASDMIYVVKFTIKNNGKDPATPEYQVLTDGNIFVSNKIDALLTSGESKTVRETIHPFTSGDHTIEVRIIPLSGEENVQNNNKQLSVTVLETPPENIEDYNLRIRYQYPDFFVQSGKPSQSQDIISDTPFNAVIFVDNIGRNPSKDSTSYKVVIDDNEILTQSLPRVLNSGEFEKIIIDLQGVSEGRHRINIYLVDPDLKDKYTWSDIYAYSKETLAEPLIDIYGSENTMTTQYGWNANLLVRPNEPFQLHFAVKNIGVIDAQPEYTVEIEGNEVYRGKIPFVLKPDETKSVTVPKDLTLLQSWPIGKNVVINSPDARLPKTVTIRTVNPQFLTPTPPAPYAPEPIEPYIPQDISFKVFKEIIYYRVFDSRTNLASEGYKTKGVTVKGAMQQFTLTPCKEDSYTKICTPGGSCNYEIYYLINDLGIPNTVTAKTPEEAANKALLGTSCYTRKVDSSSAPIKWVPSGRLPGQCFENTADGNICYYRGQT